MLTWLVVGASMGLASGAIVIGFRASGGERPSLVVLGSVLAGVAMVLFGLGILALLDAAADAWNPQLD